MMPECREIKKNIYHLIFPSKGQPAKTLLRFQEHFESPRFRDKIFSLDEYKKWYIANSPRGKKTGRFTYYRDWDGFNIPSNILEPFYKGKFDPLSKEEKTILRLFKNKRKKKFYIIATFRNSGRYLFKHEVAHGLFYTNPKYKKEVTKILKRIDRKVKRQITNYLTRYGGGYNRKVWTDEIHAHVLVDLNYLNKNKVNSSRLLEINKELEKTFNKYFKIHSNFSASSLYLSHPK